MISEIGTMISTVSLLLQLRDRYGEQKVRTLQEYKESLRAIVSTLYFEKALHNLSHTILDLDATSVFNFDMRNLGIVGFQKAFDASFGQIVQTKMNLEITPNLPIFKGLILDKPHTYKLVGFSNSFVTSINSLNYCYPRMIVTYEELHTVVQEMLSEVVGLRYDADFEIKLLQSYETNRHRWKRYIEGKNRDLMTYADQSILNGIAVLDTLFLV